MEKRTKPQKRKDNFDILIDPINSFITLRQNPLLILYWSDCDGEITDLDIPILERVLRKYCEENNTEKIEELDIVIFTRGGEVNASYLLAQLIRGYAKKVNLIVPKHAYSGGTMIALSSNKILMGISSCLSPIDIKLGGRMALIDIEKYVEFIGHSCDVVSLTDERTRFPVLVELLKELIHRINPIKLGEIFRLRSLSEYYARILLIDYMFKNDTNRNDKAEEVIKRLTSDSPTHSLDMDINIVKGIGLNVEKMNSKLYKLGELILDICFELENKGEICQFPSRECKVRMPFFQIFNKKEVKKDE